MYPSSLLGGGFSRLRAALRLPGLASLAKPRTALAAEVWPLRAEAGSGSSHTGSRTLRHVERAGLAFQVLTVATVLSIFGLVILGGVVRLTGSGLGCPDWPLCHGSVVPPMDKATLIEYSHRLVASVAGVLVLATALVVWRSYRNQPWLLIPATLGLFLLVVQVLLGGFTVLKELAPEMVLAHLATAEALLACMVVVCVIALGGRLPALGRRYSARGLQEGGDGGRDRLPILALGTLLAAYALLLSGSYVTVSGATVACGQWWPLCQGQVFPEGYHATMHAVHRVFALPVGILIVATLVLAWRRKRERSLLGWVAAGVGGLFLAQVLIGASVVWSGFPMEGRLLHLAMASLVWVGLAALAVLSITRPRSLYLEAERQGP